MAPYLNLFDIETENQSSTVLLLKGARTEDRQYTDEYRQSTQERECLPIIETFGTLKTGRYRVK
ncbi:Hypothetical protein CINCED_3A024346 [Cinara cedri]|uniref:Uncharacterized protein n=1 Tax=Cinara cedri TaxID=506608 RepID=A0A5E4MHE0_9HEMI|nr:Hypothetical protein CINCED_3A024346 [Cinara cedri]